MNWPLAFVALVVVALGMISGNWWLVRLVFG